jgi:glycosyltransferase involved in cell wall biosynthesis
MSRKVLADLRLFDTKKPAAFVSHPLYDNFGAPVPLATARTELGLPQDDRIILFFGFIRPYKGLDILLRAMAEPSMRASGIRLLVAGEFYEDSKPYFELLDSLQLGDRIILRTEFIPDSRVRYYLCAADLVVQPYRNATQSGVTPLAYHFSKPMVVTRVGALPDMVPEGKVGLVCEPDPASLAEAILRFFTMDPAQFADGIETEKKQYTWQRLVQTLTGIAHDIQK